MSDHIPSAETPMGDVADDPPPDFPDDTDPSTIDCDNATLVALNAYIKDADDVATELVNQLHWRLDHVSNFKGETAVYVSQCEDIVTDWVTEVQSINDSYNTSIDAILSDEATSCTNTVDKAALVNSALSVITFETHEDEIALLLAQALTDLNSAKAHLADTISYKNDVDTEVANIVADVTSNVATKELLIEAHKGICVIRKGDAIEKQDELLEGWTDLQELYEGAHNQPYWSVFNPASGCYEGTAHYQDLEDQWNDGYEHVRDADRYINNV